ncbi:1-phosphofructokinase family hexose kinase [Stackebrandtia albiflava]|uniref:1-phosphofructokinase family hexose kinase n=1 Tax=Stackebrandtia albiflava TaxID=406432 RepID=UPI001FCE4FCB|nr:1-phosphofructokinase family hexose kinase [Stackebrandtia albiflava]
MILTVALNAALDVTYRLDRPVTPHATHRVTDVTHAAGGKALNTARILHTLREPVIATGLLGGHTGERVAALLPAGLRHSFTKVAAESRRAVVVADPDDATGFWEPGPHVTRDEWRRFLDRYTALAKPSRVVVLSGSLPPGLPVDTYATLVHAARRAGAYTILDCDGPSLHAALPERPDLVKPNATELAEAMPHLDTTGTSGTREAAEALRAAGAGAVVASRGPAGLVAVTGDGHWRATPARPETGNPTGAGDASVAGLAHGVAHRLPWPRRLRGAAALSAASVRAPIAGRVDVRDYLRLRSTIHVEEL